MKTANAIENMTDAGDFEILAIRVLRLVDEDYLRMEHLGVNADGKTVKNPLDGFSKIPNSNPSKYVLAAFSTGDVKDLERKLLFDRTKSKSTNYKAADDGDLIKAARLVEEIKEREADAEFIFTFCTNKQPDLKLMQKGYEEGEKLGIEVRFLARSKIRDCLDTKPEGQWLRKVHLKIDADTLSLSLLRDISEKSNRRYSRDLFCSNSQIIDTATTKKLIENIRQSQPSIHILVGESGSGKSVASFRVLADVISKGGFGIWIPGDIISGSMSLEEAISSTLRSIYPSLSDKSGHEFLKLAAQSELPFVIVIDDLNRSMNVSKELFKLISWYRQLSTGEATSRAASHFARVPHLIVPVWDHFWSAISADFSNSSVVAQIRALPMTTDEAIECIGKSSTKNLDFEEASRIVQQLEYDPILIGLWGELDDESSEDLIEVNSHSLIENYIDQSIQKDSANSIYLPADFREAVETLSTKLLAERDLYPDWSRVCGWLNNNQLDVIRHLCASGRICRVVQRNEAAKFEFRHDRLLETTLSDPLRKFLADVDQYKDLLSDPFFAESVARTIVKFSDWQAIEKLKNVAPLLIYFAIRYIDETNTDFAKTVIKAAKEWLLESTKNGEEPPAEFYAVCHILEETQHELVLTVTEDVKNNRNFSGARLLNGDTIHGKHYVSSEMFYPNATAWHIENLIVRATKKHNNKLYEDLAADLNNSELDERQLHAALILAGYFGDTSLATPVLTAWKKDSENECLVEALWAALRCSDNPSSTLGPMLDSWAALSDEADADRMSDRNRLVIDLQFSMRHGVRECVIEFLVERAENDPRLSNCLAGLLQRIDHPLAVKHVAKRLANIERELKGSNRFSFWVLNCRKNWDPLDTHSMRLAEESRNAIFNLFDQSSEEWLRKSVLRTWITTTNSKEDFDRLPSDIAVSESVLRRRAQLGDRRIQNEILKYLSEDIYWFSFVPPIWGKCFIQPLDQALSELASKTAKDFSGGQSDDHFILQEVMRDIPVETSRNLLIRHWESLKYSSTFCQIALYVGGETLLTAVHDVIQEAPGSWNPFEYLSMTFGFITLNLQDRLTDSHIDALLPYVSKLRDTGLMHLAEWLQDHGRKKDLNETVIKEIEERVNEQKLDGDNSYIVRIQRLRFPSENDHLDNLSEVLNQNEDVYHWCLYSTERGDTPEIIRGILQKWVSLDPSSERVRIVAKIIVKLGQREDLIWLKEFQDNYGNQTSNNSVDQARFVVRRRTLK